MKYVISLAVSAGEAWAALRENDIVVELRAARDGVVSRAGEIWLGRIVALRPELPAVLVQLGRGRPAFLSAEDVVPKSRFGAFCEGESVVVEIIKDARAEKMAGVTMRLSRPLTPPTNAKPPLRLDERLPPAVTVVAPWLELMPATIEVDDRAIHAELRQWLLAHYPMLISHLVFANEPLYERSGIAHAIEQALALRLALPGGGFLVIEPTALGVAIDVDSGAATSTLAVNLEAARALARQIRLRNLSGPMMAGFIAMKGRGERGRVRAVLEKAIARHVPDCRVLGQTRLGHIELVRKRRAPSLAEVIAARSTDGH